MLLEVSLCKRVPLPLLLLAQGTQKSGASTGMLSPFMLTLLVYRGWGLYCVTLIKEDLACEGCIS